MNDFVQYFYLSKKNEDYVRGYENILATAKLLVTVADAQIAAVADWFRSFDVFWLMDQYKFSVTWLAPSDSRL